MISPLLANVALHGMEQALGVKYSSQGQIISSRAVVRYADDFVVFCESRADAEAAKNELDVWLAHRGLSLSQEKTRIVHLTEGFDFLGFNIRHYAAPKTSRSGYKLLIKPSKQSVAAMRAHLRTELRSLKGQDVQTVLKRLNPIIRGEANYYRIAVASTLFKQLDHWMWRREECYARKRHPTKPWYWRKQKYWGRLNSQREDSWVFGDKHHGGYLLKFSWFNIRRHVLVKGRASPDDPKLRDYWANRATRTVAVLPPRKQQLARHQNHVCPLCGMSLYNGEEVQEHHRRPRAKGGTHALENLTLVHLYCQQQIHSGKGHPRDTAGTSLLV